MLIDDTAFVEATCTT